MAHIPHSTIGDEPRFVTIITDLIKKKELKSTPNWKSSSKDEKAKVVRKQEAEKEAKEAEDLAKELGVWDEFYGSGKAAERKRGKAKGKGKEDDAEGGEDHSALQALILKKKEKNLDSFFDGLAAKYADPAPKKGKTKKRGHDAEEAEESPKKKSRSNIPPPPELDDAEFAKLQQKLFGDKMSSGSGKKKTRKVK
jgi:DnaJ family protein C protein 9